VLVDPDPAMMVMEPDRLESAITDRTRALVVVHLYGRLAPIEEIVGLARSKGLRVVEDCAQSHGAAHDGVRAGAFADIGAFSFYPTKNLGAFGDAGAIVTDDSELAERARLLREYGERARYDSVLEGRNSRLDTVQAALLSVMLTRLDVGNARRREIAARYDGALGEAGLVPPPASCDGHVYHLYVLRHAERDMFRRRLATLGVETLVHYPKAIHQHPAYAALGAGRDLSVSEHLAAEVVSLPLYPELEDDEIDAVADAVRSAAGVPAAEQPLT
jgi:dTDP-4-amino-4,6-dideoxygalactose transaminase